MRLARFMLAGLLASAPARAAVATRVELACAGPDFAEWVVDTDAPASVRVEVEAAGHARDAVVSSVAGRFHRARIDGLAPGTEHGCRVLVDGAVVPPGPRSPASFVTLVPPGELVFRFATVTDTHVGEAVAGLVGGVSHAGFSWPDPANPHWRFTNEAAVREIAGSGIEFVIHKGDLTAEAAPQEVEEGRALFDRLGVHWWPLRGNHDRPHEGRDAFVEVLGLTATTRAFDAHGHRFLLLDSSDADGNPILDEERIAWVEAELRAAADAGVPVWLVLHHAVSELAGPLYSLWGDGRDRILAAIGAAHPYVVGVLSGHSHRNVRLSSEAAPGVPFVETASTKEYPGAWTEVRVYDRGWMQLARTIDCPECREWYATTTAEYGGLAPEMQMGALSDRCFVVPFDPALRAPGPEPAGVADAAEASDGSEGSSCAVRARPGPGAVLCLTLLAMACRRPGRRGPRAPCIPADLPIVRKQVRHGRPSQVLTRGPASSGSHGGLSLAERSAGASSLAPCAGMETHTRSPQ